MYDLNIFYIRIILLLLNRLNNTVFLHVTHVLLLILVRQIAQVYLKSIRIV